MKRLVFGLRQRWAASPAMRDLALLCLVAVGTLAIELALVERKYAIFGGGFGQSQPLTGAGSILLFGTLLIACHAFVLTLLFAGLRWLHLRLGGARLFPINFLVLVPALLVALLAAKYEVLSYFSDAISFELIRNLGGGSLFDALLFVLSEGALMVGGIVAGLVAYVWVVRWWLRRRTNHLRPELVEGQVSSISGQEEREALRQAQRQRVDGERISQTASGLRIRGRWLVLTGVAIAGALLAANQRPEVRSALGRFNASALINGLLAEASDFDRDGYGLFSAPADRWPFDGARYPFALDVPGNGVDEDGIGGDFVFAPRAGGDDLGTPATLAGKPRHLILIVLESARADALGRRYAGREVTPTLNAMAASGSSFPAAYSHVGFTTASLKSLFSGRLETQAGGPSLFRDLAANGYRIGVLSGQAESFGDISEVVGMEATADVFEDAETLKADRAFGFAAKGSLLVDGKVLLRELDRNFGRREDWQRPVFLYLNLQSAHFPYHNPDMEQILPGRPIARAQINLANRERVAATYWNAIAQADAQIGALIARLKALGVYEDSLVLVTADHGESLFDDGFLGHGHMLNRQQTHIPLVVNVPGVASAAPIGLSDYRALILGLLGAQVPDKAPAPVLQYIGTLDRPSFVGMVEPSQRWTVLELQEREVRFSDVPGMFSYDELGAHPELKARADRLVEAWARERWVNHARGNK